MTSHHNWFGVDPPSRFPDSPIAVDVDGPWALFTRPELQSERVSYPVITPTAAVGLLQSIFWKPQFKYVVDRIDVLQRGSWTTMRRNEVAVPITRDAMSKGFLDADAATQQRMSTLLTNVGYRIHVHVWVHPEAEEQNAAKWRDQLRRRLQRGQCFRTPYLGMREFHADLSMPDDRKPDRSWTEDLGLMLHSIEYDETTGKETYDFFDARVAEGTLHVPRLGIRAANLAGAGR